MMFGRRGTGTHSQHLKLTCTANVHGSLTIIRSLPLQVQLLYSPAALLSPRLT
jgi:hypothetical protein